MNRTALLLIDLQNDYFAGGHMELVGADEALYKAKLLLKFARAAQLTVIFMHHFSVQPGATFFIPETRGVDLHNTLAPQQNEIVLKKHFPNSFRQTKLDKLLQQKDISRLLICGMMSHMCVDATTRAAFDKDYSCMIAHDACATKSLEFQGKIIDAEQVHGSFMAALGARYAQVTTSIECIDIIDKQMNNGKDSG